MDDKFTEAAQLAALFFGTEIQPEALEVLLQIRYPEITHEDPKIIVAQALAE